MMTTSPLLADLMAASYHRVRLFTTVGIYEGRLSIHLTDDNDPTRGIERLELGNYTMPGQEGLSGVGVVFDPETVKGVHLLAATAGSDGPALNL